MACIKENVILYLQKHLFTGVKHWHLRSWHEVQSVFSPNLCSPNTFIRRLRNWKRTRTEMRPAIVSGIVTGDAPLSYWLICPLSLLTVPEVFAKLTRPSFLLVSKVANFYSAYTAISRKVVGKVIWDMINTVSDDCTCRTYFCCFPLALANTFPRPFVPILSNFFKEQWT